MAGAREFGEVESFPADGVTLDEKGYVLSAVGAGDGEVQIAPGGTDDDLIGVNYVSSEDQHEDVVAVDEVDVVRESPSFPVRVEEGDYRLGEQLYLSTDNDGTLNKSDTGNQAFGTVAEPVDTTGDGITTIQVRFQTN